MPYEFLESEIGERRESELGDFLRYSPDYLIEIRALHQAKVWPGLRAFGLGFDENELSNWTPDAIRAARKHYAQRVVEYRGTSYDMIPSNQVPTQYTLTDYYDEDGTPKTSGRPEYWLNLVPTGEDNSRFNQWPPPVVGATVWPPPPANPSGYASIDWTGTDTQRYVGYYANPFYATLSGEITHHKYAKMCIERLNARGWDGVVDSTGLGYADEWEFFNENTSIQISTNYYNCEANGTYSYAPILPFEVEGQSYPGIAYLGFSNTSNDYVIYSPNVDASSYAQLWSWWVFPEWGFTKGQEPLMMSYQNKTIDAQRLSFRCTNSNVDYFIARVPIYMDIIQDPRLDAEELPYTVAYLKVHTVAQLVSSGTLAQNDWLEVPVPYSGEFTEFMDIGNRVACGYIAFAILGETQGAFTARTGIQLVGTADTLVNSSDQDSLTADRE